MNGSNLIVFSVLHVAVPIVVLVRALRFPSETNLRAAVVVVAAIVVGLSEIAQRRIRLDPAWSGRRHPAGSPT